MFAPRLVKELWILTGRISRCALAVATCGTFLVAVLSPSPGAAQSASFRSVDTNSDGVLTFDELVAEFGRDGANRLMRSTDHNGDGRITISELRRGPDDDDRDDDQRQVPRTDRDDDREDDQDDGDDDRGDNGGDDAGDDNGGDEGRDDSGGNDDGDDDGDDDDGGDDD